jgi:lysophospholipase L1-like esterase
MPSTTLLARPRRSRATALLGAVAIAAATLVAGPAATATPQRGHHPHGSHGHPGSHAGQHGRPHDYLALGDSVPFGYRPPAVTPPATYLDAASFTGYPEVLARRTRLRVANTSCPGETTASMIDATAQSNGCESSLGSPTGYRTAFPLHVAYTGSQLDHAVEYLRAHRRTRLVSLMIGANDLFLCQKTTADQCTGADFAQLTSTVAANVRTILDTLRDRAGYRHRVVLVTYYSLDYGDPVQTGGISALDAALVSAATSRGAVVADGFGAMRRAAAGSDGDACAAGLVIALPTGGCDVHPTRAGQEVLADAVQAAVHRHH